MLASEHAAECFAAGVDGTAEDDAVWAREIDMFENTMLVRLLWREMNGLDAGLGNAHHFAGFDFADVLRVEQIEGASFGGDHPGFGSGFGGGQFSEDQRAKAARIADGVEFVRRENEERIGAFDLIERIAKRAGKVARLRPGDEMHNHFGIAVGLKN